MLLKTIVALTNGYVDRFMATRESYQIIRVNAVAHVTVRTPLLISSHSK